MPNATRIHVTSVTPDSGLTSAKTSGLPLTTTTQTPFGDGTTKSTIPGAVATMDISTAVATTYRLGSDSPKASENAETILIFNRVEFSRLPQKFLPFPRNRDIVARYRMNELISPQMLQEIEINETINHFLVERPFRLTPRFTIQLFSQKNFKMSGKRGKIFSSQRQINEYTHTYV